MGFFQKLLVGTFETIAQPIQDKKIEEVNSKYNPEIERLKKRADKSMEDLQKHLKKYRKENPEAAKTADLLDKL